MSRNLAWFSDGTANAPGPHPTNVRLLFEATFDAAPELQSCAYDKGLGTESWPMFGRAFGAGATANVLDGYRWLAERWELGDRIFLFGFSRGAFTVRVLAGVIARCGLVTASYLGRAEDVHRAYRANDPAECDRIFERFAGGDPARRSVHFVGAWDTVGTIGLSGALRLPVAFVDRINPWRPRFHNGRPDGITHAAQALALDEARGPFAPILWDERFAGSVEQVWFRGCHSDVGGGNHRRGLSDCALDWMADRAATAGLVVDGARLDLHPDPSDAIEDSRAGLGRLYPREPRNVRRLCAEAGALIRYHESVTTFPTRG